MPEPREDVETLLSHQKPVEDRTSLFESILGSVYFWWAACLCCAGILAWGARHSMNPDGLSYLDLASDALIGGPSKLVSGVWSPAYPALITIALFLFRPSSNQEFPLLHLVNFICFAFALWAFSVFLRYWIESMPKENRNSYFTPFAFCTFLWFMLMPLGVEFVEPDLGVAAIVFLAAGISCRLCLPGSSRKHYLALGFVLGAGYYIKAALLPLGVAFLAILLFTLPLSSGTSRRILLLPLSLSLLVMLLVITPLVGALSVQTNRLNFGDAGRLNYVWHVNGLYWNGGKDPPEPNTTAEHPAPKLLTTPLTLEFAAPIKGTYPLWYDPAYWYAGAKVRFNLRQQIGALIDSVRIYKYIAFDAGAFISGAIALWVLFLYGKPYPSSPRVSWWLLAWPLAACSMYALVHVEPRYVAPFFVLYWLAIYRALTFRVNKHAAAAVCVTVLLTVLAPFADRLGTISARIPSDFIRPRPAGYQIAGTGLHDLGLQDGDRLAIVGYAFDSYYARYARLRVVAQVPNAAEFWRLSAPELQSLTERLTSIGVKALVAPNRPASSTPADWKDVKVSDSSRLSVLILFPEATKTR